MLRDEHVEQVCVGVGVGVVEKMPQSRSCRASARHEKHGGKGLTHGLPCEWLVGNAHVYVSFMLTLVCYFGESHRSRFRIGISTSAPMRTRKFPVDLTPAADGRQMGSRRAARSGRRRGGGKAGAT